MRTPEKNRKVPITVVIGENEVCGYVELLAEHKTHFVVLVNKKAKVVPKHAKVVL